MSPFHKTELQSGARAELLHGDAANVLNNLDAETFDLVVSSPPYCIGKEYDKYLDVASFKSEMSRVMEPLLKRVAEGGSVCWQVGYHVKNNEIVPLDFLIYELMSAYPEFKLRNRIIWTFGHGAHSQRRFSGRHEVVLWYTNGDDFYFDLNSVRIPQKYPGKKSYKGPRKGNFSGNPDGKNPEDIWDIPNVKAQHVEKTEHPCQFPTALVRRLVRALCPPGGLVVDPFVGSGSTPVAALLETRHALGIDLSKKYLGIASDRLDRLSRGDILVREDLPVMRPDAAGAVSKRPAHFKVFGD